jgi:FkbM family methyltransferase
MYVKELISLYNVRPKGILHVGAHLAEESLEYSRNNYDNGFGVTWIEAQPLLVEEIRKNLNPETNKVYNAVAWNIEGVEMEMNITSKSASSSLFDFGTHAKTYPDITIVEKRKVQTSRLDHILSVEDKFELVVLDIQGAELQAIEGLGERIDDVNWIFTEVNRKELYQGCSLVDDLDAYLDKLGFQRCFTAWDRRAGWGDALYVRNSIFSQSRDQKFHSILYIFGRYCKSFIPQQMFPFLVKLKKVMQFSHSYKN